MSTATTHLNTLAEPDESTRLLPDAEAGHTSELRGRDPTPLPKTQLGALLAVRIVDPIAYTQIFPYINQLLADLRIAPPEKVGFYSGLIESAYSLAQMLSVYQWGRISDTIGRRPVVIFGLIGVTASTIAFGLSTSLFTILASRFLGGLLAGNIAVMHSILVEITDDSNQNIAVPIYSLAWSTGTVIGSLVGGTFADATQYSKYFSWPVLVDHPHLPPCIISAMCALLGVVIGHLLIKETLPSKRIGTANDVNDGTPTCPSDADSYSPETVNGSPGAQALLAIPALRAMAVSGFALSFLSSAFDVVFTLFCYSPVDAGGLGLQPSTIGKFLAFAGTMAVLLRLVAMPYILRQFDYATTYNVCMYLWPAVFALLPFFNMFASARPHFNFVFLPGSITENGSSSTVTTTMEISIWIGLALVLALSKVAAIPYSITMLLIKRHSPAAATPTTGARSALGRSNGLVQFAMCLGRAVGPVIVSAIFTTLNGSAFAKQWGVSWTWSAIMVCFAVMGARVTEGLRQVGGDGEHALCLPQP